MSSSDSFSPRSGFVYGIAAYSLWGLVPIYFNELKSVPPFELLAYRVFFSVVLMLAILTGIRRWGDLRNLFRNALTTRRMLLSTVLISINWFTFLYGVLSNQILQTSLGYFIAPLVNIALGIVIFSERLRWMQWLAILLAGMGVGFRILIAGEVPWIALTLAFSFSLYGMVRKKAAVDGILGLTVETLLLMPLALLFLGWVAWRGPTAITHSTTWVTWMIILSGAITAAPLILYAQAVRRLPYSTIGFLQYLSPSVTFVLAVFVFHEPFPEELRIGFGLIWAGLLVYSIDAIRSRPRASGRSTRNPLPNLPGASVRPGSS
ncbi:EamA family transporter RarD [Tuwongella immobilis]|uniref:EamA domain-containing protein n=1 Tax=Tuwongella immobilis TaxID=692036 RepID=A0A6C2YPM3_9BACT|nr:EamA family transporter RarD [Tuwongella immobilis]VIP03261.1 chloramphenical resistance permease : RarD protein, DMT superfamily transporter OS=Geobacter sulfurreducens (strain DL-1 / KN400) GN=rarD PE=4 SV=2: EamA: EamA [Tuwongella immobilis]VTS03871.1 chloramphenical resistance permease : RarD protein, DMT superfamily transporter OS=Geobacter sulfurreducens (strain DL-1 / KN400) GN=rarD PE=4 SV=2: EamA: EamA [Tuwongella immobilis]